MGQLESPYRKHASFQQTARWTAGIGQIFISAQPMESSGHAGLE
jgi:hypothetical protein